jgi:hypothetical protein
MVESPFDDDGHDAIRPGDTRRTNSFAESHDMDNTCRVRNKIATEQLPDPL